MKTWEDGMREAAAICRETVVFPPGHRGQWEGYGAVKSTRSGKECAVEIERRIEASNRSGDTAVIKDRKE